MAQAQQVSHLRQYSADRLQYNRQYNNKAEGHTADSK
jgi:hypothetical protein